jgi:hypothetical protein
MSTYQIDAWSLLKHDYTHLPISFEHPGCELNRKKAKFECYG